MLVLLSREQVSKYWPLIGTGIIKSSGGRISKSCLEGILRMLYVGGMQCWANIDDGNKVTNILITTVMTDELENKHKLLIYAMANVGQAAGMDTWRSGLDTLKKFAASNGCKYITAYSTNEKLIPVVKRLGAGIEYFISIPVTEVKDENIS